MMLNRIAVCRRKGINRPGTMLVLAAVLAAMAFAPVAGLASEEDFAMVAEVQLTALTTCTNFGVVKLTAKQREDRAHLESLRVSFAGKTCAVPAAELQRMGAVDLATLQISSEIGYPQRDMGPYLYCCVQTPDRKTRHRLVFSPNGFKDRTK